MSAEPSAEVIRGYLAAHFDAPDPARYDVERIAVGWSHETWLFGTSTSTSTERWLGRGSGHVARARVRRAALGHPERTTVTDVTALPDYDDLPMLAGLDVRHAWDVWGRNDVLGSINLVTPERVARAAAGVRTGELFPLDLPLDQPNPPLYGRRPYEHHVRKLNRHEMDDHLDAFHPQGSTQWDALGHVRCREHGYWGGRQQDPTGGPNGLGIDHWALHGIAGRGILLDVAAFLAAADPAYDALRPRAVTAAELAAVLDAQGVAPEPGDIWCVRFGWPASYLPLDLAARTAYAETPEFVGLRADEAMARFLWNHHPAALLCDNPAVEVQPGDPAVGSLHRRLLPALGTALGEMFDYERLAPACAADGLFTFLFVANPIHVPGGLGSPGNAVAIR